MPPPGRGQGGQGYSRVSTFKIYLSGLPDGLKNTDIKEWFEEYGRTVECEVFKKNYGFVHMEDAECGRKAIQGLNKKEVNGKVISVSISKNEEPPNITTTKLFVKNLPPGMHASRLRSLFQKYGLVLEAEITGNKGMVSLECTGDIRSAINDMNGFDLDGNTLHVEPLRVNHKDRFQQAQPQEWSPKKPPAYAARGHPPSRGRYSFGGGYGPSAHAEEFYSDDYGQGYEGGYGQEYYEEEYYEPPVRRYPATPPTALRAGIDYVRRDGLAHGDLFETAGYGEAEVGVSRNPVPRLLPPQAYHQDYEEYDYTAVAPGYYGRGGGAGAAPRGRGRGRGRGGPSIPASLPQRKRFVSRGEPYPAPPGPNPRALFPQPRGGRGARGSPMMGRGMRPKIRGERGGKKKLTVGKLAKLNELESTGVEVPKYLKGKVGLLASVGFIPPGSKSKAEKEIPSNNPNSSGGGNGGPSLLAEARARAASAAAGSSGDPNDSDPFAPSAAEKRLLLQQQQRADPGIDFTADIMLS